MARRQNPTCEAISTGRKTHFANNKKPYIYEKYVDLVQCNISRKNQITQDVWPSNYCAIAYVVLSQKCRRAWSILNWIDSHRRVDKGVTVGNCRVNRFLFADEFAPHAWIFSAGSLARI